VTATAGSGFSSVDGFPNGATRSWSSKRHLATIHDVDSEAGLRLEVDGLLECIASEDVVEGLRAFAERRRPFYRGR
jgi:hypothetical protein